MRSHLLLLTGPLSRRLAWSAALALAGLGASPLPAQVPMNLTVTSTATEDGYLTSFPSATNNDATGGALRIGDNAINSGQRGLASFNTSIVASNATYTSADFYIVRGLNSNDPSAFAPAYMEIKKGAFNNNATLESADYSAGADAGSAALTPLTVPGTNGTSSTSSLAGVLSFVNQQGGANSGVTQVRIRYTTSNNSNFSAQYIGFFSGEAGTVSNRPALVLAYSDPNLTLGSPSVTQDINSGALLYNVTFTVSAAAPITGYTVTSVTPTGADAGEFTVTSGATGGVTTGNTYTIGLSWDPASVGAKTASLSVATNRGTFSIALNATGVLATPTPTPTPSETATPTPSETETPTPTPSETETPTPTPSETETPTPTPSETETPTPTASRTATPTPSRTPTPTASRTATPTASRTETPTPSETETPTPTASHTATPTPSETATPTPSPTETPTPTIAGTPGPTPTPNAVRDWAIYE